MDATDRQEHGETPRPAADARSRGRLDRRAEALRANLKRRKSQSRGRADAEREAPAASPD